MILNIHLSLIHISFGIVLWLTDTHLVGSFEDLSLKMASRGDAETSDHTSNINWHEDFGRPPPYGPDNNLNKDDFYLKTMLILMK